MLDKAKLQDFFPWAANHIKGDEAGKVQIFLARLFQAFGQSGSPEFCIRKAAADRTNK